MSQVNNNKQQKRLDTPQGEIGSMMAEKADAFLREAVFSDIIVSSMCVIIIVIHISIISIIVIMMMMMMMMIIIIIIIIVSLCPFIFAKRESGRFGGRLEWILVFEGCTFPWSSLVDFRGFGSSRILMLGVEFSCL